MDSFSIGGLEHYFNQRARAPSSNNDSDTLHVHSILKFQSDFIHIILFHPHRRQAFSSKFFKWRNWDSGRSNHLPKVIQMVWGRAGMEVQVLCFLSIKLSVTYPATRAHLQTQKLPCPAESTLDVRRYTIQHLWASSIPGPWPLVLSLHHLTFWVIDRSNFNFSGYLLLNQTSNPLPTA